MKNIEKRIAELYPADDPQFLRSMNSLLGPPVVDGNKIKVLLNGIEIFPAMLAAIRSAKKTITFETHIYWAGKIGDEFANALCERTHAGVRVHVLLDWAGTYKMEKATLEKMMEAGIEVKKYRPLRWYNLSRMNYRTHRKILVVDGLTGFTGGVGIADLWTGHAEDAEHWRDTHFHIEGPAVAQMQAAFMANWMKTTGEVLHGGEYFPEISAVGNQRAQMFKSSPVDGTESVYLMYLLSITAARKSIHLSTAYFVPDALATKTLVNALKRGVRVQLILPGTLTDVEIVRHASRSGWAPLLKAGAEIYEYQPTMFHCKVMIVDDIWVSVGSTNFDNRSFSLNDEANLNIYDGEFALQQVAIFNDDLQRSKRITLEQWQKRPLIEKITEQAANLLRPQL